MKDHLGRTLSIYPLLAKQDTFWAALAYRLYESESAERIAALREKVLLHFASLVFGCACETLRDFDAQSRTLKAQPHNPQCYRHPAIQTWVNRLHRECNDIPGEVRSFNANDMRDAALHFIRINAKSHHCSCRHTLLYLFASAFLYDVYLHDARTTTTRVLQAYRPERQLQYISLETAPEKGTEEFFVYLCYTGDAFQLLLPQRQLNNAVPQPWFLDATTATTSSSSSSYQLVRCEKAEVHRVGVFTLAERYCYYCVVDSFVHPPSIYRVLPSDSRILSLKTPVFVYASRGRERHDPCTCVGYADQEGNPLAFLLNPREQRLIVLIPTGDREFAQRCLAEEMKLKP